MVCVVVVVSMLFDKVDLVTLVRLECIAKDWQDIDMQVFINKTPEVGTPNAHLTQRTPNRSEEHTSELQSLRHLVCLYFLSFPTRRSSDLCIVLKTFCYGVCCCCG